MSLVLIVIGFVFSPEQVSDHHGIAMLSGGMFLLLPNIVEEFMEHGETLP